MPQAAGKENRVSVVVPVYNEEKIIGRNAEKLCEFLEAQGIGFEILLCNNGSTDATLEIARELAEKNSAFVAASVPEKGIGYGVKKGVSAARFENIAFFPIDLSFNLSFIPEAAGLLKAGKADVIIGSKYAKGSKVRRPFSRKIFSFFYGLMLNIFFGLGIKDTTGTLAFRKSSCAEALLNAKSNDAFIGAEFLINAKKAGAKIVEIPVSVEDMRKSDSKIVPLKDSLKMFKQILKKRFS